LDFRRIVKAVAIPVIILVILNLLLIVLSPLLQPVATEMLANLPLLVAVYAGYRSSKGAKYGFQEAATGGALTLAAGLLINVVVLFALYRTGMLQLIADAFHNAGEGTALLVPETNIILLIVGLVTAAIIGTVLGAIGGFIADRTD
jgi:hypothetical protein